nr:MAG TPA: hypothetical protein [Caudoviricetes sp.]
MLMDRIIKTTQGFRNEQMHTLCLPVTNIFCLFIKLIWRRKPYSTR